MDSEYNARRKEGYMNKELEIRTVLIPIENELDRLDRVISDKEKQKNTRLKKKMKNIREKIALLREMIRTKSHPLVGIS